MRFLSSVLCLLTIVLMGSGVAIPKERVVDRKLSDEAHYKGGHHNPDYDHEAFLGEEEAKEFEDLSPEESRARLGKLFDKIDENADGFIDKDELQKWIKHTQHKYIDEDVARQWKNHNPDGADTITWEQYKKTSFGFMDGMDENELKSGDGATYTEMLRRDKRRWDKADGDGDGKLTKAEFTDFLHPEESANLQEIVVLETMEDIDKDKDGKITLEEYIGDLYHGVPGEQEPDWVSQERDQFREFRDKNGDGVLDTDEVKAWILPPDYDHSQAEADHLIYEADGDSDRKLSKAEVLDNYDLFVGSQATDFGEYLNRHDEF